MSSDETPAAQDSKGSASVWKERMGPIMGVAFWMVVGALVFNAFTKKPPQQELAITNTGSQAVDIRKLARWSWQEEETTVHPGETVFWKFADGDNLQIARCDDKPPKPDMMPPASTLPSRSEMWGSAVQRDAPGLATVVLMRHVYRTAEVHVDDAGNIKFEFTDL
jgi:hypothetical protein